MNECYKKSNDITMCHVFLGVLCFADAQGEALKVFTEYRKVRSSEQALYLDIVRLGIMGFYGISFFLFHSGKKSSGLPESMSSNNWAAAGKI